MDRITVQRANVVLSISPEEKEDYIRDGFSVIDENTGKVIEQALSNDVGALRIQVTELMHANEVLKEENANLHDTVQGLNATIQELQNKSKKTKKAEA